MRLISSKNKINNYFNNYLLLKKPQHHELVVPHLVCAPFNQTILIQRANCLSLLTCNDFTKKAAFNLARQFQSNVC